MTDPEAALRETLSDEWVLEHLFEDGVHCRNWKRCRPCLERVERRREALIAAVAPLLTPRAWQPMELREHIEDAIERERATEKEAQGGSILAAACSGAIEAYRSVLEQLPPAPKERQG